MDHPAHPDPAAPDGLRALPDDIRITASFGVAWMAQGQTLEQALARADAMLYEAGARAATGCGWSRKRKMPSQGLACPV
ncbi:Unconventional myosin-XVB [Manis javanica]|nr:Unconventional myosin-XVB [Manis javanica]